MNDISKVKDFALLAQDSYNVGKKDENELTSTTLKNIKQGKLHVIKRSDDDDVKNTTVGFQAKAYRNEETNDIIISYAGTSPTSLSDLNADAGFFSGVKPQQATDAINFYKQVKNEFCKDDSNCKITLTGHSLGGMLAIITALDNYNEQMKKLGGVNKENFIKMKSQDNPLEVVTFESPNVIMSSEYGNQIYNDYKDILDLFGYICSPTDSLGILSQSREDTRLFRRAMN